MSPRCLGSLVRPTLALLALLLVAPTGLSLDPACVEGACAGVTSTGNNCTGAYTESAQLTVGDASVIVQRWCARDATGVAVYTRTIGYAGGAWMATGPDCHVYTWGPAIAGHALACPAGPPAIPPIVQGLP